LKEKTPNESEITMSELVLPNDTNLLGNLMGGRLMYWMDIAGALACTRHANKMVATVAMNGMVFNHSIRMGEMVLINAKVIYAGTTSMVVSLKVYAENMQTGNIVTTNQARMTFVAVDENGKPTPVPKLLPQTEEEWEDYKMAKEKTQSRKQNTDS